MHITFEQFDNESMNESLNEFAADLNELNESLGNLRQAGASPDYLKIIKAALKQKAILSVSPNSKVVAIEGHNFDELVADVRAASKKSGEFGMFYIGTASGTHVVVNNEPGFSDKPVGMNTDVKTLTLGKHPVTGDDMLEIYDGSGWRSSFRAQKIKDLKNRLQVEAEGYKGFIVIKDPDLAKLRAERSVNQRVTDKYEPQAGSWKNQEGESDFYANAKEQAAINRAAKANTFPSVDKMSWDDILKINEAAKSWKGENVAKIGDQFFKHISGSAFKPNLVADGLQLFWMRDENDVSYQIVLGLKGIRLENK
jgi:hypothetical protein|nr:MAG TPA: hypothetical protein [Caudoviricetes sp.]